MGTRTKAWCFTINNPVDDKIPQGWDYAYLVYQKERASTGTPHLQGYVFWSSRKQLSTCKNICDTAHWEPTKGTALQNKAYCTKADTRIAGPWEFGEPQGPSQGKRNDLIDLYDAIESGSTRRQLYKNNTAAAYKYVAGISMHIALIRPKRPLTHSVELHVGPTGTGKTRYCKDSFPLHWQLPLRQGTTLWFDGYDGHKVALIDDFKGEMPLSSLLQLLDMYVIAVPIKHGHTWWKPELVIITSNYPVKEWYNYTNRQESYDALNRRINKVVQY